MPLLYSIGMRSMKVERRTFSGVPMVDAGTKPPLPWGSVVGMSMSMLNGCVWGLSVGGGSVVTMVVALGVAFMQRWWWRTIRTGSYVRGLCWYQYHCVRE